MKGDSENVLKALMGAFTFGEFTLTEAMQEENTEPLIAKRFEDGKVVIRTQEYNNKAHDRW